MIKRFDGVAVLLRHLLEEVDELLPACLDLFVPSWELRPPLLVYRLAAAGSWGIRSEPDLDSLQSR